MGSCSNNTCMAEGGANFTGTSSEISWSIDACVSFLTAILNFNKVVNGLVSRTYSGDKCAVVDRVRG